MKPGKYFLARGPVRIGVPRAPMQVKTALSETAEHRSFLRVEEGNISRTLAFDCGRGYAQEECVMKRERERERRCFGSPLKL